MKIVFTETDGSGAYHIGIDVERKSAILEIPDEQLPHLAKRFFDERKRIKKSGGWDYSSLSISWVEESDD